MAESISFKILEQILNLNSINRYIYNFFLQTGTYVFTEINGNLNPLHINEEYAKITIFGTEIAYGEDLRFLFLCRYETAGSWNCCFRNRD